MLLPIATILCGILIWKRIGQEFMPSLNEGSFLLMPTSMPHTGIEQNLNYIEALDKRLAAIPEVETAIGKWGRVNSALDPAPAQMFENTINYRPEYILNEDGKRERFKVNRKGKYLLRNGGTYNPADGFRLIPADSLIRTAKETISGNGVPKSRTPTISGSKLSTSPTCQDSHPPRNCNR